MFIQNIFNLDKNLVTVLQSICDSHNKFECSLTFMLLMALFQVSQSQDSPLPPPAKTRWMDLERPAFHNNGITYPTEFEAGSWKCPLCSHITPRIRQHLTKHKALINDWERAETFCKEMAVSKQKEADIRRADNPKRKEVLRKADAKRAEDPRRKEVLRKADAKREPNRAEDLGRKEVLRKADKKREPARAQDPQRKETVREAKRRYAQTKLGKLAKHLAQEKYKE